ncbi:hypothetical protein [Xylocopilactobacillus apicola]|uniref:Uncharacterized protein n=1 Tax=Xylocopilactobacillus apicola TaxID=2932184 RepID=A0AAU9D3K5_9LACO|nr:hypothetical protein [Xylocopilactobacillus apicola]BDR58018.1 hypothetical protein XA3_04590 [Xylocopilactobacillus apicola]
MKKNLKIPMGFVKQTNDGRTVITYGKGQQLFSIFIPLLDVVDWSNPTYREINFDPDQKYDVVIGDSAIGAQPMSGSVKGDVIEDDLNRLINN